MMAKMFCAGTTSQGGGDDMSQQRLAADLVQYFGATRLQSRAFAGGEDGDGECRLLVAGFVMRISLASAQSQRINFTTEDTESTEDFIT